MAHIVSEFKREGLGNIPDGKNVLFDVESHSSPGSITYNPSTGEITIDEPGLYSVKWWVATETTPRGTIDFDLVSSLDGQSKNTPGCSPIKTGQVSGFAIVDVKAKNTKLWLASRSQAKIIFALASGAKAYMLITQINNAYPSGLVGVYHTNLSASGSFYEVTIGRVVYRLQYASATAISMHVKSTEDRVVVDVKRSTQYEAGGVEGSSLNNYDLTTTLVPMDPTIYKASNEMHRTWIRQQDPVSGLWSLHEVDLFASNGGARISICVYLIYKDVDVTAV